MSEFKDIISQNDNELRKKNIECIRKYVDARTVEERGNRWKCYVEDCTSGAAGLPRLKGIEKARMCTEWNLKYFPNYVFNDNIVFQTQDPNLYVVMSKGTGGIYYPAYGEEKRYDNVYFHVIRMRDGMMQDYYEYSDTRKLFETLGFKLPELQVPGGWPEATEEEMKIDPYMLPDYSMPAAPDVIPADNNELRQKNIDCIRKYVDARTVEERAERWKLYVDDCTSGAAGAPVLKGKDKARICTEWNLIYFPNYVFNNNVILQTQDPNLFMVMSDGTGGINYPAYGEEKQYNNIFFHIIRMRDGQMQDYYEYSNAALFYPTFGFELPHLDSPAGWPDPDEE